MRKFSLWLEGFCGRASAHDLPQETIQRFRSSVRFTGEVLERSRSQPEFTLAAGGYVERLVTDERAARGEAAMSRSAEALETAEARFGVDSCILAAIWGIESDFGRTMGDYPTLDALATLASGGRRTDFWESELISALRIIASGAAVPGRLKGSWAGAMGHTQFMPSSYLSDSVSLTSDGSPDIWGSDPSDALASTANFLVRRGWRTECPWGGAANLPEDFDFMLSGLWNKAQTARWNEAGVRLRSGKPFSEWGECSLILPEGHQGPGFLVTENFRSLLRYNASVSYALSAGLLADQFSGEAGSAMVWPGISPLPPDEIRELQSRLVELGHDTGGIDGLAGPATYRSVQRLQSESGEVPDGFPGRKLLERLRR